jgi:hypothetical protein
VQFKVKIDKLLRIFGKRERFCLTNSQNHNEVINLELRSKGAAGKRALTLLTTLSWTNDRKKLSKPSSWSKQWLTQRDIDQALIESNGELIIISKKEKQV